MATVLVVAALVAAFIWLCGPNTAEAGIRPKSGHAVATWYGPGFLGHRTACGQTLTAHLRGVAHRSWPCGTRVCFRYHARRSCVPVVDRGPFSFATFDLTARTAQDLCACRRPYTMRVHYSRG